MPIDPKEYRYEGGEDLTGPIRAAAAALDAMGVEMFSEVQWDVAENVIAVGYAPYPGVEAQAWVRDGLGPVFTLGALEALLSRYEAFDQGDLEAFQSFDPVNNRRVAIIYDLTPTA